MQFFRYLAVVIFTFPWEWITTRNPAAFLAAFPAFVCLVGVAVLVGLANQQDQSDMLPRYLNSAQAAYLDKDYEAAEVLYRKAASLDPEKPEPKYGMAKTAEKQGQLGRAWRLMELIAPAQVPGYADAHFWTAEKLMERYETAKSNIQKLGFEARILAQKISLEDDETAENKPRWVEELKEKKVAFIDAQEKLIETADLLKQHLIFTVQQQQKNIIAHAFLAQVYLDERAAAKTKEDVQELTEKAKEHLKIGYEYSPELMFRYADFLAKTGDLELGKVIAKRASVVFKKFAIRDENNASARLRWANLEALQGNEQQVVDILTEGFQKTKNRVFMQELARYFVDRSREIRDTEVNAFGRKLEYVQRALTVDPTNGYGLARLARLATSKPGKESDVAQKNLREALASGRATAVVHMIVGTAAIKEKKYDLAKMHLRQALVLNKRMPDVLNNLAWVLSVQEPPQTQQALELLDNAVKMLPQHPEIRETRGQLHAKLENWELALTDLEYALRFLDRRAKIHDTLAKCYENLGDAAMANAHRKESIKLKRTTDEDRSEDG